MAKKKKRPRDPEGRMSLGEHLAELRDRIFIVAVFVVLFSIAGWFLYYPLYEALAVPFRELKGLGYNVAINIGGVAGTFETHLRLAAYIGVALSIPVIVYEAWAFISLGLKKNEKRWALAFLFSSGPLFLAGAIFGYFAITRAIPILMTFGPNKEVLQLVEFRDYIELVVKTCMVFGVAFIYPVFLVALNIVGILPWRTILKAWRWAILLSFIFTAAMVPTPEPITLLLVTSPFLILFFGAVLVAYILETRREKRLKKQAAFTESGEYVPSQIALPKSLDDAYADSHKDTGGSSES
ncbi:twin-arginine translocase subunit TatC [Dermabacter sp. HMSC08H10]|uniref:twin-arginine translocase subunit TatC n=1 Tax=Dermabacter sp. HMSC08H10 TaxID=1581144 RepID=UPI0008A49B97|nr:twin-arginine translocase subunit TatC [Dermabacter sp. HMSC08H10]OFT20934.1 hypothetical protein HMPREF3176_04855 [Dermabacter sp. HMSC08H10]